MRRDQTRAPEPMRITLLNTDQPRIPHSEYHYNWRRRSGERVDLRLRDLLSGALLSPRQARFAVVKIRPRKACNYPNLRLFGWVSYDNKVGVLYSGKLGNRSEARASDLRSYPGLWWNRNKATSLRRQRE